MRIVFLGSPEFAVRQLVALIDAGHDIVCVYSQPPKPKGRGRAEQETPVHRFAASRGLPVRTPRSLRSAAEQAAFAALGADVAVVVAYGLILPQAILDAPPLGCVNLHASLLPRWRGAAPIQRAIMAGDRITGVQTMRMEAGLDTGPIYATATTPITVEDNAGTLHDRLALLGGPLLVRTLAALEAGEARAEPQSAEGAVYAHKITSAETQIDWRNDAEAVACGVRGFAPAPGAWFLLPAALGGARVKVLDARACAGSGAPGEFLGGGLCIACGEGAVELLRVQRAGKTPITGEEFLRGAALPVGVQMASPHDAK